jgi:hypothetical protein
MRGLTAGRWVRGFTGQFGFGGADRVLLSPRDSELIIPLPRAYRGGQLVVEYATVCFRSQEDFGPVEMCKPATAAAAGTDCPALIRSRNRGT